MSFKRIVGTVLAANIFAAANAAAATDPAEQPDVFKKPEHLHVFVCNKERTGVLKAAIDIAVSRSDAERLQLRPEDIANRIGRTNIQFLAVEWHNAWVDAAAENEFTTDQIRNPQGVMAQAVSRAIAPRLQKIESESGISVQVTPYLEGITLGTGTSCNIGKKRVPGLGA